MPDLTSLLVEGLKHHKAETGDLHTMIDDLLQQAAGLLDCLSDEPAGPSGPQSACASLLGVRTLVMSANTINGHLGDLVSCQRAPRLVRGGDNG